ncbi:MAG: sigma-70 family RNA polymerase sigma factor [candidate division WOR-3 bacterium]|nr:sigma-70 family RNA polymerase sigma factor [candidate division WOR-3 bacterium]
MVEDNELVSRFQNGEENCFDELVERYQNKIYSLAYRMVHHHQDAWDLAQDTFIRAYQGLPKFKRKSSFYTWLYQICVNLCINFSKKSARLPTISQEQIGEGGVMNLPSRNTPEKDLKQKKLQAALQSAINQLPEQQRAVFLLRQYQGLKNDQIAKVVGCSTGAVKANYFHAIRKLRNLLQEWV